MMGRNRTRALLAAMLLGLLAACGGGGGSKNTGTTSTGTDTTNTTGTSATIVVPVSIQYVAATPQVIYLAGSAGPQRADVVFLVLDAKGTAAPNQRVRLQLSTAELGATLEGAAADGSLTLTTDSDGKVSAGVRAGTVPGAIRIAAALVDTPVISTTSLDLRVAVGKPSQANSSIAVEKLSIEGYFTDGAETSVTFSVADRQGNPVPDGVQVNFVTQGGVLLPPSCVTANSRCSTTLRSQGARPADGRVTVLAYTTGEEDFVDLNGNNVYDAGEPFTDMGNAFRDDNRNGTWDAGEFQVVRAGTQACAAFDASMPARANTCDGKWGEIEVRRRAIIALSRDTPAFSDVASVPRSGTFAVTVSDGNGNNLGWGSTVSVSFTVVDSSSQCQAVLVSPATLPNQVDPPSVAIKTTNCLANDTITLTVTTPSGKSAIGTFTVS